MTVVLLVLLGLIVLAAVALVLFVKQKRTQGAAQVREALGGDAAIKVLDDKAISKGTESGPHNNLVGMGTLGYNGDELLFVRWSPPAELRIAAVDLLSHAFVVDYKEQTAKTPLLMLTYRNPEHSEGETPGEDCIAFEVQDPDAWDAALKA
jgi:hypothetical protein